MRLTRRLLLQSTAAAAATAAVLTVKPSWANLATRNVPGGRQKVLEIFLRGGASQWGAFWYNATLGGASGTGDTTTLADDPNHGVDWAAIRPGGAPPQPTWNHTNGSTLMGRTTAPLFEDRPDGLGGFLPRLSDHMRVIRVRHDLLPHAAAIPYATTGTRLGRPTQSGLGAALWRLAEENNIGTPGVRSLVFRTGNGVDDSRAATSSATYGNHGPARRPPIVTLGDQSFYDALARMVNLGTGPQSLTQIDPLHSYYRARYEAALVHPGPPSMPVRSAGFAAYSSAIETLRLHAQNLHTTLSSHASSLFQPVQSPDYGNNMTRNAIDAAVDLLAGDPSLRHISVIDGGVYADYDTHGQRAGQTAATIQNGNLWSVLEALAARSDVLLNPANGITVFIHSEFGRVEKSQGPTGTEHHMDGYVNVVISSLIGAPRFVGIIDPSRPENTLYPAGDLPGLSPTDVHAAVAQIAGIDPWDPDMFDLDQASLPGAAPDAALDLLGVVTN